MSEINVRRTLSVLALTAALSLAPFSEAMAAPSRGASGFKARVTAGITSLWQALSPIGILKEIVVDVGSVDVGSRWDPNGLD